MKRQVAQQQRTCHRLAVWAIAFTTAAALAHDPIYVIVDSSVSPPRLSVAPGSQAILGGETVLNFAPSGVYANQYVTDLPAYDATLFPFAQYPTAQLLLQRVHLPPGFGMYQAAGSTTPILTNDGDLRAFSGHTHYIHHVGSPGIYKASFRFVDGSGGLTASEVFTVTFRAYRSGIDSDGDGVLDQFDNCVNTANATQADGDGDSVGDACDDCLAVPDRNQLDLNQDGRADACRCSGQACNAADVNGDGQVDQNDLVFCAARFSANTYPPAPPGDLVCDLNHDGRIDVADMLEILVRMPGQTRSAPPAQGVSDP